MKHLLIFLGFFLGLFTVEYMIAAFIYLSINPAKWDWNCRSTITITPLIVSLVLSLVIFIQDSESKRPKQ